VPKPNQKIQKSRRKLLAAMSVGVAAKLPDLWSKPTVASVMLPAHAKGSPGPRPNCDCAVVFANASAFSISTVYGVNLLLSATIDCVPEDAGESCVFTHSINGTTQTINGLYNGIGACSASQFIPLGGPGACATVSVLNHSVIVNFYDAGGNICSDTQALAVTCNTVTV